VGGAGAGGAADDEGQGVESPAGEDGPEDIGEEFARFIRLRGEDIQEHIHRDDGATEYRQEHELEGMEQDQHEEPPVDTPRTLRRE